MVQQIVPFTGDMLFPHHLRWEEADHWGETKTTTEFAEQFWEKMVNKIYEKSHDGCVRNLRMTQYGARGNPNIF